MNARGLPARPARAAAFLDPAAARTVGQLAAYTRAVAAAIAPGRPVVLACADRYVFTAGLLAAWARGAVVHLPANMRADTVTRTAAAAGASVILHDQPKSEGLDLRALEPPGELDGLPAPARGWDEVAAVVYTSGSQGVPVAHEKTLGQLLGEAGTLVDAFALGGRRVLASAPCHHIYGLLFGVLAPLLAGGAVSRTTPLYPAEVTAAAQAIGAEIWVTVPPHLGAFADTDPGALRGFLRVFSSGAPVPAPVLAALVSARVSITQVFGSTETGGIGYRDGAAPLWTPLPGVQIGVKDGLLAVDAPWLPPAAPRPVLTSDQVELVPGGFAHRGRADDVVKVGGRRVDLGEIEARLGQIAGVKSARVIAVPSEGAHGVEILAAVASEDRALTVVELRRRLAANLDAVALPRRMRIVPALPVGPAGKIARADLLALFAPARSFAVAPERLDAFTWRFTPPPELGFFAGHFPGHPVLPAIVQLERLAVRLSREAWADLGPLRGVSRVKFKQLILPGHEIRVQLQRPRPDLVKFELTVGGESASAGNLLFSPGAPA